MVNGCKLLGITKIKQEIERLKKEKNKSFLVGPDDVLEKMMRIAFSDIKHFMDWGIDEDGINYVNFKNSNIVDGDLISEVKKGKDGNSIKLEDRQKALEWLANYFLMNPLDKHKVEFDRHKQAMDNKKFEQDKKEHSDKMAMEEKKMDKENNNISDQVIIIDDIPES